MIKKQTFKACCGSKVVLLNLDKPVRKSQLYLFKEAGYLCPTNFENAGVFYVQQKTLIATGSMGGTKLNLRCSGPDCDKQISMFEELLEKAIHS